MFLLLALIVAWLLCDPIAEMMVVHMRSPDFSLSSQQIREQVFPGLSAAEVSEALGKPSDIIAGTDRTVWGYRNRPPKTERTAPRLISIVFEDGVVAWVDSRTPTTYAPKAN